MRLRHGAGNLGSAVDVEDEDGNVFVGKAVGQTQGDACFRRFDGDYLVCRVGQKISGRDFVFQARQFERVAGMLEQVQIEFARFGRARAPLELLAAERDWATCRRSLRRSL